MVNRYFRELSVTAVLVAVLALLWLLAPQFFDGQPLLSRLTAAAPRLLVAGGITLVMLTRQIDISVGSVFAVCAVCAAGLLAQGWSLVVVGPVALLLGALFGAFNGALVAGLGLPSIVVTLATMVTLREGLRLTQQGVFVNLSDGAQWFGTSMPNGQRVVCGLVLFLWIALTWGLSQWSVGRWLYAVGSDAEAARLAGLRPRVVTFGVFAVLGGLTGLAALLSLVQSPQVDPATGRALELEAIAAAVVGGVAINGGRGSLLGVLAGFLLLLCVSPALTHLGIAAYWDKALQGTAILLAVVADGWRSRGLPGSRNEGQNRG